MTELQKRYHELFAAFCPLGEVLFLPVIHGACMLEAKVQAARIFYSIHPMRILPYFFLLGLLCQSFFAFGAKVDTLAIPSAAMNKAYKAAVVLPATYAKSKAAYPVLYLLHGGGGQFSDWLKQTPDKLLIHKLADQYNLI
jgi:hypothetical protein